MPRKPSNPPPQMTWGKASPVLIGAGLFDGLRAACALLWFLGPALLTLYCSSKVTAFLSTWTFGLLSAKTAGVACGAGAAAVGAYGFAITAPLGTILAMAVGFCGWLAIGFWIMLTNRRLLTEHPTSTLWMLGSLAVSEVPLVDVLPGLSVTVWRLYGAQIKRDAAAFAAWEKQEKKRLAEEAAQVRMQQIAALNAARAEEAAGPLPQNVVSLEAKRQERAARIAETQPAIPDTFQKAA